MSIERVNSDDAYHHSLEQFIEFIGFIEFVGFIGSVGFVGRSS